MIKVLYKCDRCGKEREVSPKDYKENTVERMEIGYTRSKGKFAGYTTRKFDICEDCLNEFIEWMEVNNNDDA